VPVAVEQPLVDVEAQLTYGEFAMLCGAPFASVPFALSVPVPMLSPLPDGQVLVVEPTAYWHRKNVTVPLGNGLLGVPVTVALSRTRWVGLTEVEPVEESTLVAMVATHGAKD